MSETDQQIAHQWTDVDGVPVLWAESGRDPLAALVFRVGLADETLASSGITHLVEHLALSSTRRDGVDMNGQVTPTRTLFIAKGPAARLGEFLTDLCERLRDLPWGRIDHETQILDTEAQHFDAGGLGALLRHRFGARGHGLAAYPSIGLPALDDSAMHAWAASRFTAGNAVAWMTFRPPDGLRLPLVGGPRFPPVELPISELHYPAAAGGEPRGVGVSFIVKRSASIVAALYLVLQRTQQLLRFEQGVNYALAQHYEPFGADIAHAALLGDLAQGHEGRATVALWDLLEVFAREGPTDDELHRYIGMAEAALLDRDRLVAALDTMASDELFGVPRRGVEDLLRDVRELTVAAVAAALRDALTTAIVLSPTVDGLKERLNPYPEGSDSVVRGRSYRAKIQSRLKRRPAIVAGPEGVSHIDERGRKVTVRFADCVAMLCGGAGRRVLISADGSSIEFVASLFRGGDALRRAVDSAIPPERCLPLTHRARPIAVPELARLPARGYD